MNPKIRRAFNLATFIPLTGALFYFCTLYPSADKLLSISDFDTLIEQSQKSIYFHRGFDQISYWIWSNRSLDQDEPHFYLSQELAKPRIGDNGTFSDLVHYICDFYPINQTFCGQFAARWNDSLRQISSQCHSSLDDLTLYCMSAWKSFHGWSLGVRHIDIQQVQLYWIRDFIGLLVLTPFIGFTPQIVTFYVAFCYSQFIGRPWGFGVGTLSFFAHILILPLLIGLLIDIFGSY